MNQMQTIVELRDQVRALTQALLDAQETIRLKDAIIDALRGNGGEDDE